MLLIGMGVTASNLIHRPSVSVLIYIERDNSSSYTWSIVLSNAGHHQPQFWLHNIKYIFFIKYLWRSKIADTPLSVHTSPGHRAKRWRSREILRHYKSLNPLSPPQITKSSDRLRLHIDPTLFVGPMSDRNRSEVFCCQGAVLTKRRYKPQRNRSGYHSLHAAANLKVGWTLKWDE